MTPTARTLAECRKRGWVAQVVEHYNIYSRKRVDLFGIIDVVAIVPPADGILGDGCILGIQATSGANHASRRTKALEEPRLQAWLDAGARFEIWSWSKRGAQGKRKLWTLREEPVILEDFYLMEHAYRVDTTGIRG